MQKPLPRPVSTLGIDFGTSNSAVSWAQEGGLARLLPLEGPELSMPTAVFYNAEERSTHFGRDALAQYLAGTEGRLMRSLKSLLGSPLLLEKTEVNHQQISSSGLAYRKGMATHSCPVAGAMHAVAADPKLGKHGFEEPASVKQRQVFRAVR